MSQPEIPQIYLITPPEFELSVFPQTLAEVLDAHAVACVRLALHTRDEDRIKRAADGVRAVCHEADVALVIDAHVGLVEPLGLDGVHLTDGSRSVRKTRSALGGDAIVGSFCGTSRHDGMTAGEQGADYVVFGPVSGSTLGDGTLADAGLFGWWSEMIEVPVVAEGGLDPASVRALAPAVDFFGVGEEVWTSDDPVRALGDFIALYAG